jgi:hypothetical protein
MPAGNAEADRGDRGADEPGAHAVENLSHEHEREARPQCEDQRRDRNQDKTARCQTPLPTHRVGECAARDLRRHRRQSTDGERKANILLRPTEIGQVKRQERAEAHLHVGQEKVQSSPRRLRSDTSRSRSLRLWRCSEISRRDRLWIPTSRSRIRECRRPVLSAP